MDLPNAPIADLNVLVIHGLTFGVMFALGVTAAWIIPQFCDIARCAAALAVIVMAASHSTRAAANEPFPVQSIGPETDGHRTIRTNRWWWVEVQPGIFAPAPSTPAAPGSPARTESERQAEIADGIAALARLATLPRPDIGYEPRHWCIEWTTAGGQPRWACMEQ